VIVILNSNANSTLEENFGKLATFGATLKVLIGTSTEDKRINVVNVPPLASC
jgi:hypothetical protein